MLIPIPLESVNMSLRWLYQKGNEKGKRKAKEHTVMLRKNTACYQSGRLCMWDTLRRDVNANAGKKNKEKKRKVGSLYIKNLAAVGCIMPRKTSDADGTKGKGQ
ncbi:hypothetical protein TWF225_011397 [Orbilia oligospora]|nr:hypothetical protein TWF225_011397 [Orbilia oligospora]KAF3235859.1 hypothetical protein TWF128_001697 [Orbilia oligospora]KAF3264720.1 hypothetical protein TWF217_002910 [Orbilia oligospora]KAF3281032.1 hypothetical protein TWF132_011346 [Orbilia oligospora]